MNDRTLGGACALLLGTDQDEGRRLAVRLTALARRFPGPVRQSLYAGTAALDTVARVRTGRRLADLDALRRERLCAALAANRAGRQLTEALKLPMLMAAGAGEPQPSAAELPPVRPDAALTCVPAATWPARATADAVVVGSGAGGAMVARELARAGLRVVVCEEGRRFTVADFRGRPPVDRFSALYRDGGGTVALGVPPVLLPTGRGVGGTTLVNSGTCYRTPERVLRRWRDRFGVAAADPDRFGGLLDEVERTLDVAPAPHEVLGRNGLLALAGAHRLGWRAAPLRRNAPGCGGCCECVVGCPRNAKFGVHLNALPQACAAGAVIVTGARVDRVLTDRGPGGRSRAAGVVFGDREILAPVVVVAAGAIETPRLLRRSGLGRHPGLGRGMAVHPATSVAGRFAEPVDATRGVLQSVGIEELHGDGILIEATAGPRGLASFVPPGLGRSLRAELDGADRLAFLGAMVADQPAGSVGDRVVRYQLARSDADRLRRAVLAMGRVLFAAGATEVLTGVARRPYARSVTELADVAASAGAAELHVAAFHPTGTARMGADAAVAPLDPAGRVRGTRGVYVADASALPSCPEVNPQVTVMAMALAVASAILD